MLDGLRGTGLTAQLDAIHRILETHASTLTALEAHQQAALNALRMLLEHRASAGSDHCPALFSIRHTDRIGLHPAKITITLWCEWPSGPHWGGLSPVSRPEDRRIIYLCPAHTRELDYPYTPPPQQPTAERGEASPGESWPGA
jgi:hypothetical protein